MEKTRGYIILEKICNIAMWIFLIAMVAVFIVDPNAFYSIIDLVKRLMDIT